MGKYKEHSTMKRAKQHQNESGKPTSDRGKPPHKGGHRSGKRKVYFTIGGDPNGTPSVPEFRCGSPWKGGRTRPSSKFKK